MPCNPECQAYLDHLFWFFVGLGLLCFWWIPRVEKRELERKRRKAEAERADFEARYPEYRRR